MSVSIRKVDEPVYDGTTGAQTDTHTRYELGGEIDGTFVPFANVRESYVSHLQRLDQEQQKNAPQDTSASDTTASDTTTTTQTGEGQ